MDGPVVKAAIVALEKRDVNLILPWVPKKSEKELQEAFEKALHARTRGKEAMEVADYWFFETAVRLHREGEGAPYTGLKPAGLDWGPVVPKADRAIEQGNAKEVIDMISRAVEEELRKRFNHAMAKKAYDKNDVDAAREYVHAMLGFVLFSHRLYSFVKEGDAHGD
jgi:hypothetical protein